MGRTHIINGTQMYLDHYAFFEEPDPGLPMTLYIDGTTHLPSTLLDLLPPIAVQHFQHVGNDLTETSRYFKTMSYGIAPAGLAAPVPQAVLDAFAKILFHPITAADLTVQEVAVGQFDLPPPATVTGSLVGNVFSVKKMVDFRVQILVAYIYMPLRIGIMSPFITNGQAAGYLGVPVPPGTDPNAPLAYEWKAELEMSTANSFVRPIASLPPPFADPWAPGTTEVRMEGKALDNLDRYSIVGSTGGVIPTSTVPAILQVLFGTTTPVCQFAYAEHGVLLPL